MVLIFHKLCAQNLHPQAPEVILIDMNRLLHYIAWPCGHTNASDITESPKRRVSALPCMRESANEEVCTCTLYQQIIISVSVTCFLFCTLRFYCKGTTTYLTIIMKNKHNKHQLSQLLSTPAPIVSSKEAGDPIILKFLDPYFK